MKTIDRYAAGERVLLHLNRSLATLVSYLEAGDIELIMSRDDLPGIIVPECHRPQGVRD